MRAGRTPPGAPGEFVVSFWCGPPERFTTIERYREIQDAGFTHVLPPCAATTPALNQRILDLCRQVGLKAFIADGRMPYRITGEPDARARLDAIVHDYGSHPALAGYHIVDEPGAPAFPGLAEVVAYLREKDPAHPGYINLFPNYASPEQMGVPAYPQYVRRYLETVKPFVLSYDHYHFLQSGDRPGFFANLAVARAESLRQGIPFWNIVLATQHFDYRHLSEAELRWEAMQTLAYGGKGLLWFTYWTPDDSGTWKHAMLLSDGLRDPHYYHVRRVNRAVRLLGRELFPARSTGVFHAGAIPPGGAGPPADAPFTVTGSGDLTVGLFRGPGDKTLALVTNADYRRPVATEVRVAGGRARREQLDLRSGRWIPAANARRQSGDEARLPLDLPPGGARLLRW